MVAAADLRFADGRAVDRAVRLDFHVVADHRDSRLAHLVPLTARLAGEAEAVAADDDAVLQQHAIADAAILPDARVRVCEEIVADARPAINGNKAVQHRAAPDLDIFIHEAIGPDVRVHGRLLRTPR